MDRSSPAGRSRPDLGATIVDVLVVLVVVAVLAGMTAPASATAIDSGRARHAAGFIHSRFRLAKIEAVNAGAHVGVVFDHVNGGWSFRVCRDATRNGLRRAEITSGADPCFDGPYDFRSMFPGVEMAVDPLLVGPGGEPGNPDPVRFGTADLISFSPAGSCTAGSIFLRSARGQQYAIRVSGINGRSRLFRFEVGARTWLVL
jgi:type II secretory pathway pseudopilin PulG